MWKNKNWLMRFSNICSIDGEGDAGGAGGGGTDSAAPAASVPEGGATSTDFDFGDGFGSNYSTPEESAIVGQLLDKGNADPEFKLDGQGIAALLKFNQPFAKKTTTPPEAKPEIDPATGQPKPKPEIDPATGQPKVAAAVTPPKAAPLDPNVAALVEAIKTQVTAPKPEPTTANEPAKPKSFYGDLKPAVAVSPQLAADLFGTDAEKSMVAMNTMVNGIMNHIMTDVGTLLAAQQAQIMQQVPQVFAAQSQVKDNTKTFYEGYPELNKPAFQQVTNQIASAMQKQAGANFNPADPEFHKALGENVHLALKNHFGFDVPRAKTSKQPIVANPPGVTKPKSAVPQPVKKQPFFVDTGSRSPAGPGVNGHESAKGPILDALI